MSATPSTICFGDSSRVRASLQGGFGGTTYLWSPGGQTVSNFYDHPTESTIYYVTVTNTAGCSKIDSVTVEVLPLLQTGFTFTNEGGTFTFTNTSEGSTSSLWIFGDGNGSFVQNPVYTSNTPGSYEVQLISTSSCGNDTTIQTIVFEAPSMINSVEFSKSVKLVPNPANDFVSLSFIAQDSESTVSVLNSIGQIISTTKLNSVAGILQQEVISIANYPAGIYVVKIDSNDKVAAMRLIVE
jgi:PKD repeat protein